MTSDYNTHLKSLDTSLVWHPFTQMQDYAERDPIIIERADGCRLFDVDGNEYLDGFSSMWCNVHGHRVPEIDAAITEQLGKVGHSTLLGLSNIPAIELAEKLVSLTPAGLNHVFYSDSGATAVEIAVKMAFQYWQQRTDPRPNKTTFAHLSNAYHGDTLGAISVGGIDLFHSVYGPLLFPTITAPSPHPYRCSFCSDDRACNQGCEQALETILERESDRLAALIIEPLVQGPGGMLMHPAGYLRKAADLCRKHDILLIVDEVATGFGRTGTMFACEQEEVQPDLLCIGKGITGGYLPVAATLATTDIYNAFLGDRSRTFYHGHTYTGNPIGCAAALASIAKMETDDTLGKLQPKIAHLAEGLKRFDSIDHVGDIRQRGFIAAVELVANRSSRRPFPPDDLIGARVCGHARELGVLLRPLGGTIVLMPPLTISNEDLDFLLDVTQKSITFVLPNS